MIKPGIWRTRGGALVSVDKRITLKFMAHSGPGTLDVWKGRCLDCGENFTWQIDGSWSPVQRHALDLVSRASAHGRVSRDCTVSHFESHVVASHHNKK